MEQLQAIFSAHQKAVTRRAEWHLSDHAIDRKRERFDEHGDEVIDFLHKHGRVESCKGGCDRITLTSEKARRKFARLVKARGMDAPLGLSPFVVVAPDRGVVITVGWCDIPENTNLYRPIKGEYRRHGKWRGTQGVANVKMRTVEGRR